MRPRDFFIRSAILCWLRGAFSPAVAFGHDTPSTLGCKALEAGQQHGMQSVAARRGDRMKRTKPTHGGFLSASW
jgi:hypothetical protein